LIFGKKEGGKGTVVLVSRPTNELTTYNTGTNTSLAPSSTRLNFGKFTGRQRMVLV
jgi:hypothetical protein